MIVMTEFRHALRRLLKRPGYTALSVAVLGIGLGVVLFLFSMINSLVLQPLSFPHAERLMAIGEPASHAIGDMDSDQYLRLKGKLDGVDLMGGYVGVGVNVGNGKGATYYRGAQMSASMMQLLGVKPLLGRGFTAADEELGAPQVILLGESVWRHAFHADPHIIGRSVRVSGTWATVIGVLPASFNFPRRMHVWLPLRLKMNQHRGVYTVARLAPATQLGQVRAELDTWAGQLQRVLPTGQRMKPVVIGSMKASFIPTDITRWVWLMFGAAALVLLLACINVANLQLVQSLQRRHELALRSALGSSRTRLMIGALAESLVLSALALAVAFPIAYAGIQWLVTTWRDSHPDSAALTHYGVGGWVAVFGVVIAVLSTVIAGSIPAWRASRVDLQDALRDGSKGSGGGFARVTRVMVVAEVALTVVLLVGAGMFVGAIHKLTDQLDVGATHAAHVLTADVALPSVLYQKGTKRVDFFHDVVAKLRQDPGVVDATASNTVPSAKLGSHEDVSLPGHAQPTDGWPRAQMAIVDPHFLDTYGVHLTMGRFMDARDRADSAPVAVIDGKMAAAFWPHQNPLNRTFIMYPGKSYAEKLTVIGVIQPLQLDSLLERSLPSVLIPLQQAATAAPLHSVGLAVRTHVDAATFAQHLAAAVHAVDPQVAVYDASTQARDMARKRIGLSVLTEVFSALGLIALLLAAAGLYGVLAFSVEQRTREIGIRRAIGADSGAIIVQVGRRLFWQLGIGLVIGLVLAWPWSNLLADPGLHTHGHDPAVFIPVLALVIVVAAVSALVPLARALRVDPAVALRHG